MESKLVLYNTLTRRKEEFEPLTPGRVGMYVCGPTVYGDPHLGHARPAVTFDLLFRYLKASWATRCVTCATSRTWDTWSTTPTRERTKLPRRPGSEQLEPMEVAQYYTNRYHHAMEALNVETPSHRTPCVGTYHRADRVREEDSGRRVSPTSSNGSVYFDVEKYNQELPLRQAFGTQPRRYRRQHPRAGRSERQAQSVRLRACGRRRRPNISCAGLRRGARDSPAGIWSARP